MRVVVVGATGNVGTSLVQALVDDPQIDSIVGLARRVPSLRLPKTTWVSADITRSGLAPLFEGADAVVHLAWVIQPSRNLNLCWQINVEGSRRVFSAAASAGVPSIVYASSVGAYSPGPKDKGVDETWPTGGIPTSFYSRHKAEVERILDRFEKDNPDVRVVRLRPGLIFKRRAASEVRRLFLGPFVPNRLLRPRLVPVVPDMDGLVFQAVHSLDAGEAYRLALTRQVSGAFNIAADPVLDPEELARALDARRVRVSPRVARFLMWLSWKIRLQPSPPGWLDMALDVPVLDTTRARRELGWVPKYSADEALLDLLEGFADGAGDETPALDPRAGGRWRIREILTGVGARSL